MMVVIIKNRANGGQCNARGPGNNNNTANPGRHDVMSKFSNLSFSSMSCIDSSTKWSVFSRKYFAKQHFKLHPYF